MCVFVFIRIYFRPVARLNTRILKLIKLLLKKRLHCESTSDCILTIANNGTLKNHTQTHYYEHYRKCHRLRFHL